MAKYQTTLTGPQMDAALVAMPDAEAYAIGKRNGQDVPSTDPTYHNNAKYYAENILNLTADATVDQVGSPSVDVTVTQGATAKNMSFAFHGISGGGSGVPTITIQASQIISEDPLIIQFTDAQYTILINNNVVDFNATELTTEPVLRLTKYDDNNTDVQFSLVHGSYVGNDDINCKTLTVTKSTKRGEISYGNFYKVTSIYSGSTNSQIPSAKCVYDIVSGLNADIADKQDEHKTATATLTVAGWSSSMQTVSVTGVTTSNTVIVAPSPSSLSAYGENGVYCSAQANGTLTFTCTDTPSAAITVNVVILD